MIRVVAAGTVSDVEHKTLESSGKAVCNFRVNDSGLSLRCAAWGEQAALVPADGQRVLIEGSMRGRTYQVDQNGTKVDRTSQEVTCSVIEPLDGAAVTEDEDLFR